MGSGVQTQQRATKVPGVRKVAARDDERALETRREKNRQAQHLFRKRRQAADAVMGQRIKRLEAVVNEMSCSVVALVDDILATEALITQHPSIVTSLHGCLARVLTLSKDADCVEFDSTTTPRQFEESPPSSDQIVEHKTANTHSVQHKPSLPIAQNLLNDATFADKSLSIESLQTPIVTADPLSGPSFVPPTSDAFSRSLHLLSSQPFAAGLHPGTNASQTLHFFPFQLIEMSLTYAYSLITTAPLAAIQREFGMTLRYKGREDIIASLQWALGSGRQHVYDFIYNSAKSIVQSDDNSDVLLPKGAVEQGSSSKRHTEFLTVVDVYALLRGLGARTVSMDVMEIQITDSIMSTETPPPSSRIGTGRSWHSSTSLPSESITMRMKLNVPILMSQLVHIGVCFETGPRYPREEVWKAIEASQLMV